MDRPIQAGARTVILKPVPWHSHHVHGDRAILLIFVLVAGTLSLSLVAKPAAAWTNISVYMGGLDNPVALAFAPDGRIFFAERLTGNIRIIENGTLLPEPFYTLSNMSTLDERGLLGLALDPAYATSPYVYAYQTFDDGPNGIVNRIVRILANGNQGVSLTEIFRTPPLIAAIHNGGVIAFGPDGKLYAVVGENARIPLAQDPTAPMGKVLRMNSDGSAPTDNPFYYNASWNPLVYTYGHRNMFGIAFHPVTKGIFVSENGPECNDEVNLLLPGRNYGWGPSETCTSPPDINTTNRDGPDPVLPIWWWGSTICPTNVALYDGPKFPAWRGDLFMGDCNQRTLHRLRLDRPNYTRVLSDESVWVAPDMILDVEAGPDGAIWFTTPTTIYRLWDSGEPPVASFKANPNPVVAGTPVQFDATGSYDPNGTIVSYAWDFGDNSTGATGPTPVHTYSFVGQYNVSLTVTDNESYTSTAFQEVQVLTPPPAPLPPVAVFTSRPSPVEPRVPVTFDASDSYDSDGRIQSYRWDFGDGTRDTGNKTTHAFQTRGTYAVALVVTDNDNQTATATHSIVVSVPPIAAVAVVPETIFIGTDVRFSGTGSSDPDGTIQNWTWDFGDHSTDKGPVAIHPYAAKGRFTVTLTVEDDAGLTNETTTVVVVRNRPPIIGSSDPAPGAVNLTTGSQRTFAVTASDPDRDLLTYAWRINGAAAGRNEAILTFLPPGPGTYVVNVTVSDGTSSTSREWTVTVAATTPPPSAEGQEFAWLSVVIVLAGIGTAAAIVAWRRRGGQKGDRNGG
jgi:glucose/arabinose dehydrogenase